MALFSEDDRDPTGLGAAAQGAPEPWAAEPLRVNLKREARNEVVEDLSKEKPAYMRKCGSLWGGRSERKVLPAKSSKQGGKRMIRRGKFAGSSLPTAKPKTHSVSTGSIDKSKRLSRSLASRRANEDELSMLFEAGFQSNT